MNADRHAESVAPSKWRKRPVVIEAMRLDYGNRFVVAEWCGGEAQGAAPSGYVYAPGLVKIPTLEGDMWADDGDWIIKGVADEFYPCKPAIFAATYERHSDGPGPISEG